MGSKIRWENGKKGTRVNNKLDEREKKRRANF